MDFDAASIPERHCAGCSWPRPKNIREERSCISPARSDTRIGIVVSRWAVPAGCRARSPARSRHHADAARWSAMAPGARRHRRVPCIGTVACYRDCSATLRSRAGRRGCRLRSSIVRLAIRYRGVTSISAQLRRPDEMHSSALRASTSALTSQMPMPITSAANSSEVDIVAARARASVSGRRLHGSSALLTTFVHHTLPVRRDASRRHGLLHLGDQLLERERLGQEIVVLAGRAGSSGTHPRHSPTRR